MFGCYRRDEAADPDTFVAAVTMILSRYPADVVEAVTDPFSGLPSRKNEKGYSGLPDVADVKGACEAQAIRQLRLATYAALPKPMRMLPKPVEPPKPTIFTPEGFPRYDALKRRYESGDRPAHFETRECIDKVERYGIWTPYSWIVENAAPAKGFTQFTDAELLAKYPPREPAPAEQDDDLALL